MYQFTPLSGQVDYNVCYNLYFIYYKKLYNIQNRQILRKRPENTLLTLQIVITQRKQIVE